jgi:hypothetical protein
VRTRRTCGDAPRPEGVVAVSGTLLLVVDLAGIAPRDLHL